jgi:hypothetical protein
MANENTVDFYQVATITTVTSFTASATKIKKFVNVDTRHG